jgi:hypothetical protein
MRCPAVPPEIVVLKLPSGDIGSGVTTGGVEADKVAENGTLACAA